MGTKILKHPAKDKKHSETIVFVHHMFGNYRTTRRHQLMVNELGYDCVSFDLILGSNDGKASLTPLLFKIHLSVFEIWRRQILEVLDQVPGPKVIYAFSGPSLPALLACSDRNDIHKIICDGGPFDDMKECTRNLFCYEKNITFPLANLLLSFFTAKLWGEKRALKNIHACLYKWNPNLPILSIRGKNDPIVPWQSIKKIFNKQKKLPLEVFTLPEGKHLDGLKNFKDIYTKKVSHFLQN